tara:strand:- start:4 stop:171 length:168 start_codon:yes stop_codon:yes gene_type:complete
MGTSARGKSEADAKRFSPANVASQLEKERTNAVRQENKEARKALREGKKCEGRSL